MFDNFELLLKLFQYFKKVKFCHKSNLLYTRLRCLSFLDNMGRGPWIAFPATKIHKISTSIIRSTTSMI